MIHQLRDKKLISKRRNMIRSISIVGAFLIICALGFLALSGKIFSRIGTPIWKTQNAILGTVHNASSLVRTKSSVFNENDKLIKENDDLKAKMIDYQILKNENDQLKEMLGRLPSKDTFTLATILAKPNRSPYDTIIVDAGSNLGITEGLQVFALGNIPIGEISKVNYNNSLVMLYSNPGQTTEGVLEGSNASVELVGRGGGNFEMTIPVDLTSESGTRVTLPNIEPEVIAIIDAVISTPTDPVKKVILHSPVNIQSLQSVEIKRN